MTLTNFLNYFELDYRLYDNGEKYMIGVIDKTGVNLGNIESERYDITSDGVLSLLDRLDAYYEDYIFSELKEKLIEKGVFNSDDWHYMCQQSLVYDIDFYGKELIPYIFAEKSLTRDYGEKERVIVNEDF